MVSPCRLQGPLPDSSHRHLGGLACEHRGACDTHTHSDPPPPGPPSWAEGKPEWARAISYSKTTLKGKALFPASSWRKQYETHGGGGVGTGLVVQTEEWDLFQGLGGLVLTSTIGTMIECVPKNCRCTVPAPTCQWVPGQHAV